MLNYSAASPSMASVSGCGCVFVISVKLKTGSKRGEALLHQQMPNGDNPAAHFTELPM